MVFNRGAVAGVLAGLMGAFAFVGQAPAAAQEPMDNGSIGVRLLEAPVQLQDDPRALSYIVDNLPPGTVTTRRIEVSNTGTVERNISLYAAAASIGPDGFTVAEDRAVNELTTWISVAPGDIVMAPNSTAEAIVTIDIPQDAPEGEQYAVVWAQTAGGPDGSGIQSISRVGIRTYLSVGEGNGPPADLSIGAVTASRNADGAPELIAEVTNTGGRALDPQGTVALTDGPGGIATAPLTAAGAAIAPGESGVVTVTLDPAIPAGPWKAEVSITSGLVNKSTTVDLTFPDQGSIGTTTSASTGTPVWVWIIVAVMVLAVIIAGAATVRRRKTV